MQRVFDGEATGIWPGSSPMGHCQAQARGACALGTFPEHLQPTPRAFPSLEVCSTPLTSLGQHQQAIREGTHCLETGGHVWVEGGRGRQRETQEGLASSGPGTGQPTAVWLCPLVFLWKTKDRALLVQALGGVAGGGGPSQVCHLSACCSSRSTASARLSTYPSAFTSGWCSSLGLNLPVRT